MIKPAVTRISNSFDECQIAKQYFNLSLQISLHLQNERTDDRKGRRTTSNENLISTIKIIFSCWLVSPIILQLHVAKITNAIKGLKDSR